MIVLRHLSEWREGERVARFPWFDREVSLFPSTTLFLSVGVLLLCFCALEEFRLRENTSASGSFIFFSISNILYHVLISSCRSGNSAIPKCAGRVLFWFGFLPSTGFLCCLNSCVWFGGSKCFLEPRSTSLGKPIRVSCMTKILETLFLATEKQPVASC